jgi:hypothetical protein
MIKPLKRTATALGGLTRRLTGSFFVGNDLEAQPQTKDTTAEAGTRGIASSKPVTDSSKLFQNRIPGYFMEIGILRQFLKDHYGDYDPEISVCYTLDLQLIRR